MRGTLAAGKLAALTLAVSLLVACGGGSSGGGTSTTSPTATGAARDATTSGYPTSVPRVSVVNGFLLVDGRELSSPILPCTIFETQDADPALFPLTVGYLPEGAREERTEVSVCPDGTMVSGIRNYVVEATPGERRISVGYFLATQTFPPVLAWPEGFSIQPVDVNGQRGLLVVPDQGTDSIPRLLFWVQEHGYPHEPGAYVYISDEARGQDSGNELLEIAHSITVELPATPAP